MTSESGPPPCLECGGRGVEFRGRGLDSQYRICSQWEKPGHPTKAAIEADVRAHRSAHAPVSGRFA